jgi:hypothetical protein
MPNNPMRKTILLTLFIFALSVSGFAQTALTNDDVIGMIKSGLSPQIVIAKINLSEAKFDTSTEALIKLGEAKVPDTVVVAMMEKEQRRSEARKENNRTLDSIPEQGSLKDIVSLKLVFIMASSVKARDLIAKELQKNSRFEIVDKIENADVFINYKEREDVVGAFGNASGSASGNTMGNTSSSTSNSTATVRDLTQIVGELNVAIGARDGNRIRQIYSTRKSKYYLWEDNPAKSTTKQFLSDLNKAAK